MDRYAVRRRILASLDEGKPLPVIADDVGVTDARLLWHLRQMGNDNLVRSNDEAWWARTPEGSRALETDRPRAGGQMFPHRIVDDFEDARIEAEEGLYGSAFIQASGEHRGRLSPKQAAEFSDRLVRLIEEYFSPGRGDRAGIKHGFHWVLTPIDLHPLEEDQSWLSGGKERAMPSNDGSSINKEAALNRIAQERAIWDALVAEVDPDWADEPDAMGAWSFKDVVAHLAGWRQLFVDALVAAVQGTPIAPQPWPFAFSWSEEGTPEGEAKAQAINKWLAEQGRSRSYAQVLAQTSLQWTTMAAVVDLMPDDLIESRDALPGMDGVSVADAIVGPGAFGHFHEEHEPDIRAWLAGKQAAANRRRT